MSRPGLPPVSKSAALCAALAILLLAPARARSQEIVRRVGRVTMRIDPSRAFPGGVLVARLTTTRRIGTAWALLDGRRASFYADRGVLRALVPVAAGTEPGPATLGIGIAARRGEQRIAIPVEITARAYPSRAIELPEPVRALIGRPEAARDARRLLSFIRTESNAPAPGSMRGPVTAAGSGFGEQRTYAGLANVEDHIDALGGDRHRGLDFAVPGGTLVRAPGAGKVLFAGALALSGETVVVDHGQGIISVLQHLSRVDVRAGDAVSAGTPVGSSGQTGAAPGPLLQWRVYLHAVAVDPTVLGPILGS